MFKGTGNISVREIKALCTLINIHWRIYTQGLSLLHVSNMNAKLHQMIQRVNNVITILLSTF